MKDHFAMFAAYNAWANRLLYEAVAALSPAQQNESKGAFFGSLHNTLNHILVADRVWLHRFTGEGMRPTSLDQILYDDFAALRVAREEEDARISAFVDGLSAERLAGSFTYTPLSSAFGSTPVTQRLSGALSHVFNHQTHHRGQCHATLTALCGPSLALDLVYFLRSEGTRWI